MAVRYLLPKEGEFYKANLHCHSTCSDGQFTPEQLKDAYRHHGYSVLAFTDHRVCIDHSELNEDGFLALSGSEIDDITTQEETTWQKACHLCCIARRPCTMSPMIQLRHGGAEQMNETIRELREAGFLVHCNHPVWSALSTADTLMLEGLQGFEVYNHCSEVYGMEGNALHDYLLFLKGGKRAYPVASDDNHNGAHPRRWLADSFGGFNMIKAPELSYDAIIAALDAGHTYASTGPVIESYVLEGTTLCLRCSPVSKAILKTAQVGLNRQNFIAQGDEITEVTFDLKDAHGFAYIQLHDAKGGFACTTPIDERVWRGGL